MDNHDNIYYKPRKKGNGFGNFIALILGMIIMAGFIFGSMEVKKWLEEERDVPVSSNEVQKVVLEQFAKVDTEALSTVDISERLIPSIVGVISTIGVNSIFGSTTVEGSGSGIIVREDGYIVTNEHVISDAKSVVVVLSDGSEYPANVIGTDKSNDIAVIKIEETELPAVILGISGQIKVGEPVVAIGNPFGQKFASTVTSGIISGLNRTVTVDSGQYTLLQTDASINEGNSGGALVNCFGQVIGINSAKMQSAEGIGFAIPIDVAKPVIEQIIETGRSMPQIMMGFEPRDITEQMAAIYRVPQGIYVVSVEPGGGADDGGLMREDIIVGANGTAVTTLAELNAIKDKMEAGDTLALTVERLTRRNMWEQQEVKIVLYAY